MGWIDPGTECKVTVIQSEKFMFLDSHTYDCLFRCSECIQSNLRVACILNIAGFYSLGGSERNFDWRHWVVWCCERYPSRTRLHLQTECDRRNVLSFLKTWLTNSHGLPLGLCAFFFFGKWWPLPLMESSLIFFLIRSDTPALGYSGIASIGHTHWSVWDAVEINLDNFWPKRK